MVNVWVDILKDDDANDVLNIYLKTKKWIFYFIFTFYFGYYLLIF